MNDTLIVIPTYNEIDNVRQIAAAVLAALPGADVLFVDDNSPDGTGQVIDRMIEDEPRIHVLHRKEKAGLGRAYIAGFKWALARQYEFVFEMDADFSHDPASVPELRRAAEEADLCLGTRYKGGVRVINWPLARLVLSKGAAVYVNLITGLPVTDPTGGFKCFRRAVLESIDLDAITSNGYSFQIELSHKAWMKGFHIEEVPITFEERRSGSSKMSMAIVREALWMVWKLWLTCGMRRRPPGGVHPRSVRAGKTAA
ncbi:MAG TPA: polyprenol monophosphomannose synthase [Kiritimatiellia bacterium]|nr:polyprenol monophosphomannose synthase [Kiritimatiellia bacterium]HMP00505.1 polyprenol monophosphomannose synthase [Kiritimatiellia bacterium]HMP98077.1 polyprenol monophosphomannose synthase [Kiritimatiellia bacterium]